MSELHPDVLERAVLLRYAAASVSLPLARASFVSAAASVGQGASACRHCETAVADLKLAGLPGPSSKDWYTAAVQGCMRRVDECVSALQGGEAAAAAIARGGAASNPSATISMNRLIASEQALRALLHAGGHRPNDLIRRSMQQVHPPCPADPQQHNNNTASTDGFCFRVFISGKIAAGQPALLDALGVTHVISCFATGASIDVGARVGRLVLPCVDDDKYDLSEDFSTALDFVQAAVAEAVALRRACGLLVHCAAGMHRSVAIAAAVLATLCGQNVDDALANMTRVRPMAELTPNFLRQVTTRFQS